MAAPQTFTRVQALRVLKRHGIQGAEVYLIDLIPLLEMIWADGKAQESEIVIFDGYLQQHVRTLNALAGYTILTLEAGRSFVRRFLRERPDPALLRSLRDLVAAVRMSGSEENQNEALRSSLLAACVDIAASAVSAYPYASGERFDAEEKRSFFEILESIDGEDRQ